MTRTPPGQSHEARRHRARALPTRKWDDKRRPALVVQADFYNRRISNVLLAPITSNLTRRVDPAHCFIDVSTPDGKQSGLNQNSLVSCLNLGVVPAAIVGPKIGELPAATMQKIDVCLKVALGIA